MKRILSVIVICVICISLCIKPDTIIVSAVNSYSTQNPQLTTRSIVKVDNVFGPYMSAVDENIYYSMSSVNSQTLINIFGDHNTPMFNKAKETINPCMAFATTWGEAGSSYTGISLTTVMDFNPATYKVEIDWITLASNLEQVDSSWYIANAVSSYNTNVNGEAYHMPNALLQFPKVGDRSTSAMTGLGVGPYQITSSDWSKWDLDHRVNPVWGFEDSLRKCGSAWINCGIDPISDITVYAALSLGHQGGSLITYDFGKQLINTINQPYVQEAILAAGYQMYLDAKEKAYIKSISLSNINITPYIAQIEADTGIDFSQFHALGYGISNKGDYTIKHVLRYVFYKYYFTSGL